MFEMEDARQLVVDIGYAGEEFESKSALCYALSKNFVICEAKHSRDYQILTLDEFYEFLGRVSVYLFSVEEYGENYPMIRKIE